MSEHNSAAHTPAPQNPAAQTPTAIDAAPVPPQRNSPPKNRRKGWIFGGLLALGGLAAFGAVQAVSQPFGFGHHGFGPRHHMGAGFDPARMAQRIDYGADIILGRVGSNEEQKKKISDLIKANLAEIPALRAQHQAARDRVIELLKAEKFDKAELEKLRAQQLALADQISKRLTDAVGQASDILTPKQRQELVQLWEKRPGWR